MAVSNPISLFKSWIRASLRTGMRLPNAMTLATVTRGGRPRARVVLLKDVTPEGLTFFTNYTSPKSSELSQNRQAAIVFHWEKLDRQVRVEGRIRRLPAEESDAYWKTRPRGSQIGARASIQSRPLKKRSILLKRARSLEKEFHGKEIPRPPFWGGFLLLPEKIEFWQGRPDRLHIRKEFTRKAGRWKMVLLYP